MSKMKFSLLDFGELTADQGWFLEASGTWTLSGGYPTKEVRHLQMLGAAIDHPKHGLILYEVGPVATLEGNVASTCAAGICSDEVWKR